MAEVFVVGSLHYDTIMHVSHLPKIDETVMGEDVQHICGGKGGNQAVSASRNGAKVSFAGAVGEDTAAEILLASLNTADVDTGQVQRVAEASGMSVAIVNSQGDYGAVVASGANQSILTRAISIPANTACVVIQNEIPEEVNIAVARKSENARVILNAAPMRALSPELLEQTDILIVNKVEAEVLFKTPITSVSDAASVLAMADQTLPTVLITLGGDGLAYRERNGAPVIASAFDVEVISSHGAGDAFVGALAAKIAIGEPLSDAIDYASAAAALWVSTHVTERMNLDQKTVARFLSVHARN